MTQVLELYGRATSHYTRLVRMFAHDVGLDYVLRDIPDMTRLDPAVYGGHPALKLPVLKVNGDPIFGAQNICRWLVDHAATSRRVIWSEEIPNLQVQNAQELVWLGMSAQVHVIMATRVFGVEPGHPFVDKTRQGLVGALGWLEAGLGPVLACLPARDVSLLEHSLFCLVSHLLFRPSIDLTGYPRLLEFHAGHSRLESAMATPYAPQR